MSGEEQKQGPDTKVQGGCQVNIRFDMAEMTDRQRGHVFEAEEHLRAAGVRFDTSADIPVRADDDSVAPPPSTRDWEFDWSLKGPVTVTRKRPTDDDIVLSRVVEVLNRALDADADAITDLLEHRVPCNDELAEDPTIQAVVDQAAMVVGEPAGPWTVGMLGVLNGICGVHEDGPEEGWGKLSVSYGVVCDSCADYIKKGTELEVGDPCPECGNLLSCGPALLAKPTEETKDDH